MLGAILRAIPLGTLVARRPQLGKGVLVFTGVLQTIPSLALLLFMIPVMKYLVGKGTGAPPAIAALFLYSLLPIVRNRHVGLMGISPILRESAEVLGLPPWAVLWRVGLPLAAPMILAGVPTAAVINVGRRRSSASSAQRVRAPDPARDRQIRRAPPARRSGSGAAGSGDRGVLRAGERTIA
jgi:osmoprotectant transport system permease protein